MLEDGQQQTDFVDINKTVQVVKRATNHIDKVKNRLSMVLENFEAKNKTKINPVVLAILLA